MKILIYADRFDFGGTQVNAIELAEALRDLHGHEVALFATAGPMVRLAEEKGLRFLAAPSTDAHPSGAMMSALRSAVRSERPDVLHVWDWTQCLDAYYSVYLPMQLPMAVSVMTMALPRLLPKSVPTTLGTPELLDEARRRGRGPLELILPPVDVHRNSPGSVEGPAFREAHGLRKSEIVLVTVSRLVDWMKAESLCGTIEAVRTLGRTLPIRFVIVGDGTSRAQIQRLADNVNADLERPAVILTGALLDPRPAYDAADIVVGMGGSALRGMAFAKPVVIVGEQGFSAPFTPETAPGFHYKGIYGVGDGHGGKERLTESILAMAGNPERFGELGRFSREFVLNDFTVEKVSERLSGFLQLAAAQRPNIGVAIGDGLRTAAVGLGRKLVPDGVWSRLKGIAG